MEMIIACVLSFAVTGLLGWKVILPALRRLKAGQEIREVGPKWHSTKAVSYTHLSRVRFFHSRIPSRCSQSLSG